VLGNSQPNAFLQRHSTTANIKQQIFCLQSTDASQQILALRLDTNKIKQEGWMSGSCVVATRVPVIFEISAI